MDNKLQVIHDVFFSDQDINDILYSALSTSDSWFTDITIEGNQIGEYITDQVSLGGKLFIRDKSSSLRFMLNKEKFANGLRRFIKANRMECVENGILDIYKIHGKDADSIVQYAIFGEILYS